MNEPALRDALRAMSPRMHGADIESLVDPVMKAWTDASKTGRRTAAMTAVVDAAWSYGYEAGAARGHRLVTDGFAREATLAITEGGDRLDPEDRRMLQSVAGTAVAVRASGPTPTDSGPNWRDYLTAMGEANGPTDVEDAAVAARVGWTHAYGLGVAGGSGDAASRIAVTVKRAIGADTIGRVRIEGRAGDDWLVHVEVGTRGPRSGRSAAAQAFSPLRQIHAAPTSDTAPSTPDQASRPRLGRNR